MKRHKRHHVRQRKQRAEHQPARQSWLRQRRYPILAAVILTYAISRFGCDFNPNLQQAQYDYIHHGMSLQSVEDMLGKANYYDSEESKIWTGQGGAIILEFKGERVYTKEFLPLKLARRRLSNF